MSLHLASNRYFKTMSVSFASLNKAKTCVCFYISQILWGKKLNYLKFLILIFRWFIESIYIYSFSQHFPQKVWQ